MSATQNVPQPQSFTQNPASTILYNGAVRLDFESKGHSYTVTDERGSRQVPSVTQVLSVIDKSGPLTQWAANMTTEYIRAAIRPGLRYDEIQLSEIIEQARFNFRTVSRQAKNVGQLAHEWIEAHLRSELSAVKGGELPLPINDQARGACQTAAAWIQQHFKPLCMEHRIYSRENEFAGTIDVFGDVDGEPAIVDWKTAGAIYREFRLQTAAYAQAWAEMHDDRVPDRWVIRLDKETGEFEAVKFPRGSFRADLRGFLAAKALHLTLEGIKKAPAAPASRPVSVSASRPASVPISTPVAPATRPMAPEPAVLPPQPVTKPARRISAARSNGRIEGFAPDSSGAQREVRGEGRFARAESYQPRRSYDAPKKAPMIRWCQMQDALILVGGGTYKLQGVLADLGGYRSKDAKGWVWQIPASQFGRLQCACNEEGIRLIAADSGRAA